MNKYGMTMFENNKVDDDIAVLVNLITQLRDVKADGENEPTAYDKWNKIDWSIGDVIEYLESKYKTR